MSDRRASAPQQDKIGGFNQNAVISDSDEMPVSSVAKNRLLAQPERKERSQPPLSDPPTGYCIALPRGVQTAQFNPIIANLKIGKRRSDRLGNHDRGHEGSDEATTPDVWAFRTKAFGRKARRLTIGSHTIGPIHRPADHRFANQIASPLSQAVESGPW